MIVIDVQDTERGIAANQLERILERCAKVTWAFWTARLDTWARFEAV